MATEAPVLDPEILSRVNDIIGRRATKIVEVVGRSGVPLDDYTWTAMLVHGLNRLTLHLIDMEMRKDAIVAEVVDDSQPPSLPREPSRIIAPPPGLKV